jgi:hypothetical protein
MYFKVCPAGGFSLNENLEEERINDQIYSLISPVARLEIGGYERRKRSFWALYTIKL